MIITCLLVIFENYCTESMARGQIKTVDVNLSYIWCQW